MGDVFDPGYLPALIEIYSPYAYVPFGFPSVDWVHNFWVDLLRKRVRYVYAVHTRESVEAWAHYLVRDYGRLGRQVAVLEVGAGDGRLSHFLGEALERLCPGAFQVTATDNGSSQLQPVFPVERLSAAEAIVAHHPDVVIAAWSKIIGLHELCDRADVSEYVMIGEPQVCESMLDADSDGLYPYLRGRYLVRLVDEIQLHQYGFTDTPIDIHTGAYDPSRRSRTQSFRLKKA